MPWDDTSLWVADVAADGSLARQRQVRGYMLRQIPWLAVIRASASKLLTLWHRNTDFH